MAQILNDDGCQERVAVLITSGVEAFVQRADGSRSWIPSTALEGGTAADGAPCGAIAEAAEEAEAIMRQVLAQQPSARTTTAARPPRPPVVAAAAAVSDVRAGSTCMLRALLGTREVDELHASAASCATERWGTMRRRSVGLPEV